MKKTNALGAGTRNVTTNIGSDLYLELLKLAGSLSGIKYGAYLRTLIEFAVKYQLVVSQNEKYQDELIDAVKNGGPLPKLSLEFSPRQLVILAREILAEYPHAEASLKKDPSHVHVLIAPDVEPSQYSGSMPVLKTPHHGKKTVAKNQPADLHPRDSGAKVKGGKTRLAGGALKS